MIDYHQSMYEYHLYDRIEDDLRLYRDRYHRDSNMILLVLERDDNQFVQPHEKKQRIGNLMNYCTKQTNIDLPWGKNSETYGDISR